MVEIAVGQREVSVGRRVEIGGASTGRFEVPPTSLKVPINTGSIQVHEGSVHVSAVDLKNAQRLIQTGAPIDQAAEMFTGVPQVEPIEFGVKVKISAGLDNFAVHVRKLVEPPVDTSDFSIADNPMATHPMTDAITIVSEPIDL